MSEKSTNLVLIEGARTPERRRIARNVRRIARISVLANRSIDLWRGIDEAIERGCGTWRAVRADLEAAQLFAAEAAALAREALGDRL